jgi:SHS2 domain-containing protein
MAEDRPRHEPLEHTSEAGIIARGATLAEAFANAAEGMYALVLELDGVAEREERRIELEGDGYEALLVDWLMELVFLTETEGLVFRRFSVDELTERRLRARAFGEPFDAERHRSHNVMVKAVTHHMLEISREEGGYRVQVLFDV